MSTAIKQFPRQFDSILRRPWQIRAMAVVDAVILNVIILLIARAIMGEFPRAELSGDAQTIGLPEVIVVTTIVGLIAALLLGLLERFTERAKTIWTVIAFVVLLVSLAAPLDAGVDTESKITLALLHLGAAAAIIPLMRREPATD